MPLMLQSQLSGFSMWLSLRVPELAVALLSFITMLPQDAFQRLTAESQLLGTRIRRCFLMRLADPILIIPKELPGDYRSAFLALSNFSNLCTEDLVPKSIHFQIFLLLPFRSQNAGSQ